jgi:HK97 family phage major capsid protein
MSGWPHNQIGTILRSIACYEFSGRTITTYTFSSGVDGTRPETEFQYVASGASGAFAASNPSDKLLKLVYAVKPRYRRNGAWLLNSNTLEQIRGFKDQNNNYVWKPGLEQGQPSTLLGYPCYEDTFMPDIAANSLSILFGDFARAYTIVDRNSRMLRDPYTAKPKVLFYTTRRVGGAARDMRAVKALKFAAS